MKLVPTFAIEALSLAHEGGRAVRGTAAVVVGVSYRGREQRKVRLGMIGSISGRCARLVALGAEVNRVNKRDETPLHLAVLSDRVALWSAHGLSCSCTCPCSHSTPTLESLHVVQADIGQVAHVHVHVGTSLLWCLDTGLLCGACSTWAPGRLVGASGRLVAALASSSSALIWGTPCVCE